MPNQWLNATLFLLVCPGIADKYPGWPDVQIRKRHLRQKKDKIYRDLSNLTPGKANFAEIAIDGQYVSWYVL